MKNPIIACLMVFVLLFVASISSYISFILYKDGFHNLAFAPGIVSFIVFILFLSSAADVINGATRE